MQIDTKPQRARIVAVLGPTNTGKTHMAMERMLGFDSGIIGFPLRLLARENYDRAVKIKGADQVALITGEEKIVPPGAKYFLCTAESMPVDRQVAFLGVDEVQMCADPDRGHVFTNRLLHARGLYETMLMGADTIKPLLQALIPGIEFISRPRFSTLTYTGQKKISRLAPRSAVTVFSAADVYAIAELIRRQRGGAAVVLGALSPRTRNAQVSLYQSGEVDYLVATDAIGMGLNMDVDHVAFAGLRKFDGRFLRQLTPSELAQIAGRAGRHMNDGSFGTTAEVGPLDDDLVGRIENHTFDPLKVINWRNPDLNFSSLPALRKSLLEAPKTEGLTRAREADDELALATLARDEELAGLPETQDDVRLLWEVCRIPDFRKVMSDGHARLLGQVYRHLMQGDRQLPTDWLAAQVDRLQRTDGDIETLAQRIANIRTWTYISFHGAWLADAVHWQERTRAIEDKLSDALHERLTHRFVDRRTAVLMRRLGDREQLTASVTPDGEVEVEGHFVGRLKGFRFATDRDSSGTSAKAATRAALNVLPGKIAARVVALEAEPDEAFALTPEAQILWRGEAVAALASGTEIFKPQAEPLSSDLLDAPQRERVRLRLQSWLDKTVAARLGPLLEARQADLKGAARGLVFQLSEALGSLPRATAESQVKALERNDRQQLRTLGIRLGRESIFMPALLRPAAVELRGLLWMIAQGRREMPPLPPAGRVSVEAGRNVPNAFYEAIGYRRMGQMALRIDIIDRLAGMAWTLSRKGAFEANPDLLSLAGCTHDQLTGILKALGYRARTVKPVKTDKPAATADEKGDTQEAASQPAAVEEAPSTDTAPAVEAASAIEDTSPETPDADKPVADKPETVETVIYTWGGKRQERRPAKPKPKRRQEAGDKKKPGKPKTRDAKGAGGKPKGRHPKKPHQEKEPDPDSPFAKLRDHVLMR